MRSKDIDRFIGNNAKTSANVVAQGYYLDICCDRCLANIVLIEHNTLNHSRTGSDYASLH